MKIDINANSLRKLVRLLRNLAQELETVCDLEREKKDEKKKPSLKLMVSNMTTEDDVIKVIGYYKLIHPKRGRSLGPKHKDWRLVRQRLTQGYKVEELKTAILENSRMAWWVERNLHGIQNIMAKDSNLDSFIQNKSKGAKNGENGYNSGSTEFGSSYEGFGE